MNSGIFTLSVYIKRGSISSKQGAGPLLSSGKKTTLWEWEVKLMCMSLCTHMMQLSMLGNKSVNVIPEFNSIQRTWVYNLKQWVQITVSSNWTKSTKRSRIVRLQHGLSDYRLQTATNCWIIARDSYIHLHPKHYYWSFLNLIRKFLNNWESWEPNLRGKQ